MAAKQQRKKKAKAVKGRNPQKKHQLVKQKRKKLPSRLKRRAKAVSTEQPKLYSPRLFVSRILRQMPKVRMEAKARVLMKSLLTDLYNHVTTEVQNLSQKSEPFNVSYVHIQTALKDAMAKELAKHMAEEPTCNPTNTNSSPNPSPSPTASCSPSPSPNCA